MANDKLFDQTLEIAKGYAAMLQSGIALSVADYLLIRQAAIAEIGSGHSVSNVQNERGQSAGTMPTATMQIVAGQNAAPMAKVNTDRSDAHYPAEDNRQKVSPFPVDRNRFIDEEDDMNDDETLQTASELSEFDILRSIQDEWN